MITEFKFLPYLIIYEIREWEKIGFKIVLQFKK